MPIAFAEVQFPSDISQGAKGGPVFNTTVFASQSGFEQRNINWEFARCAYDVSHGIRNKADMDTILDFFYNMKGKATGFRFKDWSDYQLTQEALGTADNVEDTFQVIKTYSVGMLTPYIRNIYKIVASPAPIVRVNGVVVAAEDYTLNMNTGELLFDAPPVTGIIDITCQFDVPVRFDTDKMDITVETWQLESWDSIPLVEIKTVAE